MGHRFEGLVKDTAFWCFFAFASVTVILAFLGGFVALVKMEGSGSRALGFFILFLGFSLALMLGSLLFIRIRTGEEKR